MKSGVYFVHYDHIDDFLAETKKAGKTPIGTESYEKKKTKNTKVSIECFR